MLCVLTYTVCCCFLFLAVALMYFFALHVFYRKVAYDVKHLARKKVAHQKLKFMLKRYRASTNFWDYFEK